MDWTQFYDICRHINPWAGIVASIFLGYRIMILYRFRKTREQSYQLIILLGILALYLMVIILATLVSIEINNKPTIANPLVTILDIALIIACIWWPTGKRKVT